MSEYAIWKVRRGFGEQGGLGRFAHNRNAGLCTTAPTTECAGARWVRRSERKVLPMKPLIYGYLRVDLVAGRLADSNERIRVFAECEGFDLGTVFVELDSD